MCIIQISLHNFIIAGRLTKLASDAGAIYILKHPAKSPPSNADTERHQCGRLITAQSVKLRGSLFIC
jgi:hypothetical protein